MARRRRLEAPSPAELDGIEAGFRSETSRRPSVGPGIAPIAQVAAEAAQAAEVADAGTRAARARAEAEARRLHEAEAAGLVMVEVPIDQIAEGAMIRDRMGMGQEEMLELQHSIAAHGLRLPIELFEIEIESEGEGSDKGVGGAEERRPGPRYGLLSGYRRLHAVRALFDLTQASKHATIRALIRPREEADRAFVSMVEENEVREDLSHFERGRIAVIAANQGAFANTDEAVNRLFASGSKAKRSKVRSFALIFEELGDMLRFPEALTEKRGLRIAAALRDGAEMAVRQGLSQVRPPDAEEEWAAVEAVLEGLEPVVRARGRGGRPKSQAPRPRSGWLDDATICTDSGITISRARDGRAHILRLEGAALSDDLVVSLMAEIEQLLAR